MGSNVATSKQDLKEEVMGQCLGVRPIPWCPRAYRLAAAKAVDDQGYYKPELAKACWIDDSLHHKSMKYVILSKNPSFLCFLMPPWSILITFWSTYHIYWRQEIPRCLPLHHIHKFCCEGTSRWTACWQDHSTGLRAVQILIASSVQSACNVKDTTMKTEWFLYNTGI